MNWFQRLAYPMTPEVPQYSPVQIIMGVMRNELDGSGPSLLHPEGGTAYQLMQQLGPVACDEINKAAGSEAAAYGKMRLLAEAAGCNWEPETRAPQPQEPAVFQPMVTPPMGEQEKPMTMPSTEIA